MKHEDKVTGEALKFASTRPRVARSPIPERGQAFVMDGDLFEDGLRRVVVGYDVTPEQVAEITAAIEEGERVARLVDAINSFIPNRTIRHEEES